MAAIPSRPWHRQLRARSALLTGRIPVATPLLKATKWLDHFPCKEEEEPLKTKEENTKTIAEVTEKKKNEEDIWVDDGESIHNVNSNFGSIISFATIYPDEYLFFFVSFLFHQPTVLWKVGIVCHLLLCRPSLYKWEEKSRCALIGFSCLFVFFVLFFFFIFFLFKTHKRTYCHTESPSNRFVVQAKHPNPLTHTHTHKHPQWTMAFCLISISAAAAAAATTFFIDIFFFLFFFSFTLWLHPIMSLPLISLSILESRVGKGVENISFSYFPSPTPYGIFFFLRLFVFFPITGVSTLDIKTEPIQHRKWLFIYSDMHSKIPYTLLYTIRQIIYLKWLVCLFDCFLLLMGKLKRNYLFFSFGLKTDTHIIYTRSTVPAILIRFSLFCSLVWFISSYQFLYGSSFLRRPFNLPLQIDCNPPFCGILSACIISVC